MKTYMINGLAALAAAGVIAAHFNWGNADLDACLATADADYYEALAESVGSAYTVGSSQPPHDLDSTLSTHSQAYGRCFVDLKGGSFEEGISLAETKHPAMSDEWNMEMRPAYAKLDRE